MRLASGRGAAVEGDADEVVTASVIVCGRGVDVEWTTVERATAIVVWRDELWRDRNPSNVLY